MQKTRGAPIQQFLDEGVWAGIDPAEKIRMLGIRDMRNMPKEMEARLEYSAAHLWELAGDKAPNVRTAAIYAMMSNPIFLIRNEGRIMKALYDKNSAYSGTIRFLMDTMAAYIPSAERIFKIQELKANIGRRSENGFACKNYFAP